MWFLFREALSNFFIQVLLPSISGRVVVERNLNSKTILTFEFDFMVHMDHWLINLTFHRKNGNWTDIWGRDAAGISGFNIDTSVCSLHPCLSRSKIKQKNQQKNATFLLTETIPVNFFSLEFDLWYRFDRYGESMKEKKRKDDVF